MLSGTRTSDARGVAPVIGVTLLIGITVILAATVAAFAFGFDDTASQGQVPTVAISTDYQSGSSDELEFSHNSGETVDPQYLHVKVQGASCSAGTDPNGDHNVENDLGITAEFSGGRTITIDDSAVCPGENLNLGGATVHLSWRTGTGTSSTLRTWHGSG